LTSLQPIVGGLRALLLGLCSVVCSLAEPALGNTTAGLIAGYSRGTLTRGDAEAMTAFLTQASLGYEYWNVNFHGFFQHMQLAYPDENKISQGVYSLAGVGAGASSVNASKSGRLSLALQVPLSGVYTILSESKGTINGSSYALSELSTLQGGTAYQVLAGYDFLMQGKVRRRSIRSGRAYYGVYVSYLSQQFASQTTRIKTNNSVMAPVSPGKESVSYSVAISSLNFALNFSF